MEPLPLRRRSRILIKALLGMGAVVAASVVSLSGLFLLRHQSAFQRQFELRAESLAISLAGQSQFALLLANRVELEGMARAVMAGNKDVLYVAVEDASGNYVAGAQRAPMSRQSVPRGTSDIKLPAVRNLQPGSGGLPCVEASVPVIPQSEGDLYSLPSSQAEVLGRIRVAMSLQSERALFYNTLRYVVAIGVSTGGPAALGQIIPRFGAGFPLPILIVQHMPPMFTRLLAERLQAASKLRIEEAAQGVALEPGKVLIAAGDYHLRVRRDGDGVRACLDQAPPENSCRPAVDVLFRSVAETYGGAALAAVLTGMGQDGLRGVQSLKALGAYVIAQDQASSVVWGMPGAVVGAGLADCVTPLDGVVPEILRQIGGH